MHVSSSSDPDRFAAAVGEWLLRRPVENNLLLGHAYDPAGLLPGTGPAEYLWVVDDGEVAGCAWVQPPYRMTISVMAPEAAAALAGELAGRDEPLPGVNGPADAAGAFAGSWTELTGQPARRERDQWLMRCDEATRPPTPAGEPRPARPDEAATIAGWFAATMRDSGLPADTVARHTRHMVDAQLAGGRLVVWQDGDEPVGAAGWMQPIGGVARPAGVFVRPEHRQGGHAAALLAEVTARALAEGCDTCTCLHYLEYAAMQAVVEKVGFRKVLDVTEYRFEPVTGASGSSR